jgi:NAD(P)H-hydrate repair Nnr-like enzyme with NAD(P)H-hydrate dehydratase domain
MSAPSPWTAPETATFLRVPTANDDKYSRGVVGMRTGSEEFPGAAVLGVEAAWRTGTGMVRYLGPRRAADLVLQRRPETVTADGRVQAWVVGSGTSPATRTAAETAAVRTILAGQVPVVVDAGALDLVVAASALTGDRAPLVLTPHDREHAALRDRLGLAPAGDREQAALETAAVTGAVLLLKGPRR